MTRALAIFVVAGALALSGCAAALMGVGTAASIAGAVHSFYQVGSDVVAATGAACQKWAGASALAPRTAALSQPWYAPICDHLSSDNQNITPTTAAWVAEGAGRLKVEAAIGAAR